MSNEIRIKSLSDFLNALSELGKCDKDKTRFFRGHSNKEYLLEPSIYRTNKETGKQEVIKGEHLIIKDVLTECYEYFLPNETLFDKLVRMQHYDYPTRLLDISYNALVGLYFAISNSKDELKNNNDGEVIILDIPNNEIKYHDSDTVAILSALSLQKNSFDIGLYKKIAQESFLNNQDILSKKLSNNPNFLNDYMLSTEILNKEIDDDIHSYNCKKFGEILFNSINNELNKIQEIVTLLNDIRKDKPYFLPNIDYRDFYKVICVKPKLNNPRITKQNGAFLIFGIQDNKINQANVNNYWIVAGENAKYRFIIDASSKKDILEELKSFGISHQTLFPELDKQASHIVKRHKENQK